MYKNEKYQCINHYVYWYSWTGFITFCRKLFSLFWLLFWVILASDNGLLTVGCHAILLSVGMLDTISSIYIFSNILLKVLHTNLLYFHSGFYGLDLTKLMQMTYAHVTFMSLSVSFHLFIHFHYSMTSRFLFCHSTTPTKTLSCMKCLSAFIYVASCYWYFATNSGLQRIIQLLGTNLWIVDALSVNFIHISNIYIYIYLSHTWKQILA